MPTLDDVLPELSKAKVFTSCDVSNAFWHVCLDEPSSKLTAFQTPWGKFRFLKLAFGLSVSPEEFQWRLIDALSELDGLRALRMTF